MTAEEKRGLRIEAMACAVKLSMAGEPTGEVVARAQAFYDFMAGTAEQPDRPRAVAA